MEMNVKVVSSALHSTDPRETAIMQAMAGFFDADWYRSRYPDIAAAGFDPLVHFVRRGLLERRDPNEHFDSAWYADQYPDVAASGLHPLLHYLQTGATELRNPNPRFDAIYYADQHPEAAQNPLLYHLRVGRGRGYPTEKPLQVADYLPSERPHLSVPGRVFVDIVIPAYKGLAETRRCIGSVLHDSTRPLGRIIVVNDRSPEPPLSAWLQSLAADGHIHLIRNEKNIGFVASVNRGMEAAADHDVVLLNSDTEVPDGWLARLMAQAYAAPRIASVSPLSNNATICSYPSNEGGPLAFGHSLAQIDQVCRKVNAGRAVSVPTTVGFAMYIRREALKDVGYFDAERFPFGYGEENDFCLRATAAGWQHRLACDTFVYHEGSVSFGDRAEKLTASALRQIMERFPDYPRLIAQHVSLGAADPFRFAVTAELFRQAKLPVILMVCHNLGGGTRRHIDTLVQRYQASARMLLLEGSQLGSRLTLSVPALPGHPSLSLSVERIDALVVLLRSMQVSRVHIHHLYRMDGLINRLILMLGVPFDVTVHDYYAICPQINLLPFRHSLYCGEPEAAACNDCIAHRGLEGAQEILMWRADRTWQFHDADRVLCPSRDTLARLDRYGLADRAIWAPHEPVPASAWKPAPASPGTGRLRIAVLGVLADHKGARTVAAVAETADPKTTEIHLIGHTDGPFPEAALRRMKVTGPYNDADLPALIAAVAPHVIWFPMAWPETFSYTLSAAIDAGTAIAATRIGSLPERLEGRPLTWLADITTRPSGWLALFETIRTELNRKRAKQPVTARQPVPDFYARDYLAPALGQAAAARASARKALPKPSPTPTRIVVLPERFEDGRATPSAYVRLLQPLHHPAIRGDATVRVARAETVLHLGADIIVTQGQALSDPDAVNQLSAHARRIGASLVVDLDDDLLDKLPGHTDPLRRRGQAARRLLGVADSVWVSTPALAERLVAIRPDAVVVGDRLDERIWTQVPSAAPLHDDPVRFLWISSTADAKELAIVQPVLQRLQRDYGRRVAIDVLGATGARDLPDGLGESGLNGITPTMHACESYPGLVNWLTQARPPWHVGLAPLLDTADNRVRSPVRALAYAAMGMMVLASDTPVHRGSLADGPAGQLVMNAPDAWYAALDRVIRNPEWRRTLMARARPAFLANGTLAGQADIRRHILTQAVSMRRTDTAA